MDRITHSTCCPRSGHAFAPALNGRALGDTTRRWRRRPASRPAAQRQPWRFLVARGARKAALLATLTEKNRSWAHRADALILLLSRKTFTQGGKPNAWHLSDAGCAAGFLMLEAQRRGLYAHPMGGFDRAGAREAFGIGEDFDVIEVIAVGEPGDPAELPEALRAEEHPRPRKHFSELMV